MNNIKIKIRNLNLYYGKDHILKNINADIPERQITIVLGPSGCGKTSLLRSMNRLTDLNSNAKLTGNIFIDQTDILSLNGDISEIRRKMGLLAQRPYPLPMSIFNNVAYGLRISGRKKRFILAKRVEHYLRLVNLWDEVKDRLKDPAVSLSIGQQQRLCLARGLAVNPQIILADEPTSALDPISTHGIEEKFIELKNQYTIVMVTHILRQARRIADYVIFMYMGEIIEQGPAAQIFENPRHEITRAYLKGIVY